VPRENSERPEALGEKKMFERVDMEARTVVERIEGGFGVALVGIAVGHRMEGEGLSNSIVFWVSCELKTCMNGQERLAVQMVWEKRCETHRRVESLPTPDEPIEHGVPRAILSVKMSGGRKK
jgi:hypothetical protein